jgi:hypothetical protein
MGRQKGGRKRKPAKTSADPSDEARPSLLGTVLASAAGHATRQHPAIKR